MPASARIIPPATSVRRGVPHLSESPSIESMRADLSRVWSQYFFNNYPGVFAVQECRDSIRILRKILHAESLAPTVRYDLDRRGVDKMPIDLAAGVQRLK
jgi:hypothetical protein